MLVVIAFETMFGSTCDVARALADGFAGGRPGCEVVCRPAHEVGQELVARADLLVVGGPTHYHGLAPRNSMLPGRQLQRHAVLTGHPRPRGLDGRGVALVAHGGQPSPDVDRNIDRPWWPGPDAGPELDLRDWLRRLPPAVPGALAAAFDTRVTSRWGGGAASGIARRLHRRDYRLLVPPEGYLIDSLLGPLRPGELTRARVWAGGLRRLLRR